MNNQEWKIIGAYRRGVSHLESGQPCQDFADVVEQHGCIIAALADGLGSLSRSEQAARAVVRQVIGWLFDNRSRLGHEDTQRVLREELLPEAVRVIRKEAQESGDMDCNLAFLLLDQNKGHAICGHLGDCAVCVMEEGNARAYTTGGAMANATKTVLTAKPEDLHVEVLKLTAQHKGFILTSDGLEGWVYRKRSGMICKSAESIFNIEKNEREVDAQRRLDENLNKLQEWYKNRFDDDISVVVVSRDTIKLPADPTWLCTCGRRNPVTSIDCLNPSCGADVLKLYSKELKKYDNLEEMVLRLNADPAAEARALEEGRNQDDGSAEGMRADGRGVYEAVPDEPQEPAAPEPKQEEAKPDPASKKTERRRGGKKKERRAGENTSITQMGPREKKDEHENLVEQIVKEPEKAKKKRKWIIGIGVALAVTTVAILGVMHWRDFGGFGPGRKPGDKRGAQVQHEAVVSNGCCWISIEVDGHEARQMVKIPYPLETDKYGRVELELVDRKEFEDLVKDTEPIQSTRPEETEPSAHPTQSGETDPATDSTDSEKQYRLTTDVDGAWTEPGGSGMKLPIDLKLGDYVTVIDGPEEARGQEWVKVQNANGDSGWIELKFLAPA